MKDAARPVIGETGIGTHWPSLMFQSKDGVLQALAVGHLIVEMDLSAWSRA